MARRFASAVFTAFVAAAGLTLAACSSDAGLVPQDAAMSKDADFSVCKDTPAVPYMPGIFVTSMAGTMAGTYKVTLVSAKTDFSDGSAAVDYATVGLDTWIVSVTNVADGTPAAVTMTADRPTMPLHSHGASSYPAVTGDPSAFTMSGINFFQAGYWEQILHLQPTSGTAEEAVFAVCIL